MMEKREGLSTDYASVNMQEGFIIRRIHTRHEVNLFSFYFGWYNKSGKANFMMMTAFGGTAAKMEAYLKPLDKIQAWFVLDTITKPNYIGVRGIINRCVPLFPDRRTAQYISDDLDKSLTNLLSSSKNNDYGDTYKH